MTERRTMEEAMEAIERVEALCDEHTEHYCFDEELRVADLRIILDLAKRAVREPSEEGAELFRDCELLVLASYCGGDDDNCTETRPCADCLAMCNVFDCDGNFLRELGASPTPKGE